MTNHERVKRSQERRNEVLRIERVENGYMAYVGNLSCHFSTLQEAVLWAEKQVYACDTKSEDR